MPLARGRVSMKKLFIVSLFIVVICGRLEARADLALPTSRGVECTLSYVDFINSDNHLAYSIFSPRVSLIPGALKTSSEHSFFKLTYSSRCPRCGPSHTLGPIVNPSSAFNSWVASTQETPKLKVNVELERVLDTQPEEILSLKVHVKDESNPNTMTMSALDQETSLSFQTIVQGVPGILTIFCRITKP